MARGGGRSCDCDLATRRLQVDYLQELAALVRRSVVAAKANVGDANKLADAFEISTELVARMAEACSLVGATTTVNADRARTFNAYFGEANKLNDVWAETCNTYGTVCARPAPARRPTHRVGGSASAMPAASWAAQVSQPPTHGQSPGGPGRV